MSILHLSLSISTPLQSLSSSKALSCNPLLPLTTKLSQLSLKTTPIRMGGGPRTYPGGVSKWQWKRMQAKKAKQLLKARLARERQIYELRKRAELKAAVSELERPWESVEKPPTLFSVSADEQLKVLADRFQKPGGLDLWSERDGPELFRPDNGLPSSRFFPKGVVHSVRPYGKIGEKSGGIEEIEGLDEDLGNGLIKGGDREMSGVKKGYFGDSRSHSSPSDTGRNGLISGGDEEMSVGRKGYHGDLRNDHSRFDKGGNVSNIEHGESGNFYKGRVSKKGNRRMNLNSSEGDVGNSSTNNTNVKRAKSYKKSENTNVDVFDLNLQNDGSYGFEL